MHFCQCGASGVGESVDRPYRRGLVPKWLISGREDTIGIVCNCMLSGRYTGGITRRYVMGREAGWVLVGQSVCFKVEVDFVRMKQTELIICQV